LRLFNRFDCHFGKKLPDGSSDPTLERGWEERAAFAGAAQANFYQITLNRDQLHRTAVKLLNVCADLVNQAGDFFFFAELRDLVGVHSFLNSIRAAGRFF
jgi:hypothetical protein